MTDQLTALHHRFPEVAQRETRTVIVATGNEVPADEYHFLEFFCNDLQCDCRRARIAVTSGRTGALMASLDYAWEDRAFYVRWMGMDDDTIDQIVGAQLAVCMPQSEHCGSILKLFRETLQHDPEYAARIVRHYWMFKESRTPTPRAPVGRNEPCPCGSGRKFKKCCLGKPELLAVR